MTSKIVVNNIESDSGISSVTVVSNIAGEDSTQNISGINSVTANAFYGDGSNLTGAGPTLTNGADNRVVTATGAAALNGESTLTYDNPTLEINTDSSYGTLKLDGDAGGLIEFKDDGTRKWELYGATNFSFYDRANTKYGLVLKPGGDVEVSDGNLVIGTSGHGIDFSASGNTGGMSSELLDDYEEGVFNPTMANSVTLHSGNDLLSYVKVGHLVHVTGVVRINSGNSGADFSITNMPFATVNASDQAGNAIGAVSLYENNMNSGYTQVICVMNPNAIILNVQNLRQSGNSAPSLDCADNGYIGVSITYRAA